MALVRVGWTVREQVRMQPGMGTRFLLSGMEMCVNRYCTV